MTTTRTIEHRHSTHADIGLIDREAVTAPAAEHFADREQFLLRANELGLQPVFCNVTGEIVSAEAGGDYGVIISDCLSSHWLFVSQTIYREDPTAAAGA